MRFELHSNSTNEKNMIFVNIIDDNGKRIGHTLIRSFTYHTAAQLREQLNKEHKTTRKACLEAARLIAAPGTIAYVGVIELDHRERGRGYGPQVLKCIPQICKQFGLSSPNAICAYILPHLHKLDMQHYQNEMMSKSEYRKMYNTMHKTFRRAGFAKSHILKQHIVTKVIHI